MPMPENLKELIKSPIADLKNTGGPKGGSITAALFLKEFVGDIPWAHLDIAGASFLDKERAYESARRDRRRRPHARGARPPADGVVLPKQPTALDGGSLSDARASVRSDAADVNDIGSTEQGWSSITEIDGPPVSGGLRVAGGLGLSSRTSQRFRESGGIDGETAGAIDPTPRWRAAPSPGVAANHWGRFRRRPSRNRSPHRPSRL